MVAEATAKYQHLEGCGPYNTLLQMDDSESSV